MNPFVNFKENDLSYQILGTALELHKNVGPGLLKYAYENALEYDFREVGLEVKQQVPMLFVYKKIRMDVGYTHIKSHRAIVLNLIWVIKHKNPAWPGPV